MTTPYCSFAHGHRGAKAGGDGAEALACKESGSGARKRCNPAIGWWTLTIPPKPVGCCCTSAAAGDQLVDGFADLDRLDADARAAAVCDFS